MKLLPHALFVVGVLVQATAMSVSADDAKDRTIENERKLFQGTWRIVALVVDGNEANEEDANKLVVINGCDGSWLLRSEDQVIAKGKSIVDPTQKPKTVDIRVTSEEGQGDVHLGIYEIGENTRRLCFAPPGKDRPTEFSSPAGSQHILVTFRRETGQTRGHG